MSTDPHQTPTSSLDVGPLAGVTPPRPPDPATMRLLDDAPSAPVTAPVATATPEAAAAPVGGRSPRVRTIVFGAVMLVVALTVLVAVVADVTVDAGAVVLVVLVLAGLALLGGGLAAAAKEARGGPGA